MHYLAHLVFGIFPQGCVAGSKGLIKKKVGYKFQVIVNGAAQGSSRETGNIAALRIFLRDVSQLGKYAGKCALDITFIEEIRNRELAEFVSCRGDLAA